MLRLRVCARTLRLRETQEHAKRHWICVKGRESTEGRRKVRKVERKERRCTNKEISNESPLHSFVAAFFAPFPCPMYLWNLLGFCYSGSSLFFSLSFPSLLPFPSPPSLLSFLPTLSPHFVLCFFLFTPFFSPLSIIFPPLSIISSFSCPSPSYPSSFPGHPIFLFISLFFFFI